MAGVSDRHVDPATLQADLPRSRIVQAEQVHGSSVALIDRSSEGPEPIAGCDALVTRMPRVALVVRSADCLPLLIRDPIRRIVGIAHVGWRGLAAHLPFRLVAALRVASNSRPAGLRVAFGPSIRACCYEVSDDFARWAHPFVQRRDGRLTCDLIGLARHQLEASGVRPKAITDSGICTACHRGEWPSMRREGTTTRRILSFIMLR